MRWEDPQAGAGQVVGLFGGSFDPPHAGHVALSQVALKRLELDRLWWLVSPGNPLKTRQPAPIVERIAAAQALVSDPRIEVSGIEARLRTRATVDTLRALRRLYPRVNFVWLMGADNLAQFHRWGRWQEIMKTVPVAVFARPGQGLRGLTSPAARIYAGARVSALQAQRLGRMRAPAWTYIDMPLRSESSTALRAAAGDCEGAACVQAASI